MLNDTDAFAPLCKHLTPLPFSFMPPRADRGVLSMLQVQWKIEQTSRVLSAEQSPLMLTCPDKQIAASTT